MGQLKRQLVMWGAIATTTAVIPGLALADNVSPDHGGGRHGGRHGRNHRHDDAKLSVAGRALSKGTADSYGLQIRGRSGDQPTDAGGMIRFGHRGENVMEGLVGEITCLSKDSAGVVTVTGTVQRSGKRDKNDKGDKNKGDEKMPAAPGAPTAPNPPSATATADDEATAFLDEVMPWDDAEVAGTADPEHGRRGRRGEHGRRGGGELAGKDFALAIKVDGKPQAFSPPTIGDKGTLAACAGAASPSAEVTRGGFKAREAGDAKSDGSHDRGDRKGRRGGWWRR